MQGQRLILPPPQWISVDGMLPKKVFGGICIIMGHLELLPVNVKSLVDVIYQELRENAEKSLVREALNASFEGRVV